MKYNLIYIEPTADDSVPLRSLWESQTATYISDHVVLHNESKHLTEIALTYSIYPIGAHV